MPASAFGPPPPGVPALLNNRRLCHPHSARGPAYVGIARYGVNRHARRLASPGAPVIVVVHLLITWILSAGISDASFQPQMFAFTASNFRTFVLHAALAFARWINRVGRSGEDQGMGYHWHFQDKERDLNSWPAGDVLPQAWLGVPARSVPPKFRQRGSWTSLEPWETMQGFCHSS